MPSIKQRQSYSYPHIMNDSVAVDACLRLLLSSALDGSEWSASLAGRFIPEEGTCAVHLIKGWMDRSGHFGEDKFPSGIQLDCSASPIARSAGIAGL
jgi:hypothetical protein